MRTTTVAMVGRRPLRGCRDDWRDPRARLPRGELAAALATAAVASQLLFAQVTVLSAAVLIAVGRASRWRPHWLAVPSAISVVWLSATDPAEAGAWFVVGSGRLAAFLLAAAIHPRLLAHPGPVTVGAGTWLPRELPLALLLACGEAWLVLWLGWWRRGARSQSGWLWRPGLVAVVRRRLAAATLAAGRSVTTAGCAVGVATDTGKLAGFSWAQAAHGVLLTGPDTDVLGVTMTSAALRRRKTVVIVECAGRARGGGERGRHAAVTARVGKLAGSLGVPVVAVGANAAEGAGVASVARAIGRAIRCRETVLIATMSADAVGQAAADLAAVLHRLRDLGLRADCLAWINGAELVDSTCLAELLALGPLTGTGIVLSTGSPSHAAHLASVVAIVAAGYPMGVELGQALAARAHRTSGVGAVIGGDFARVAQLHLGQVLVIAFGPGRDHSLRAVPNCRAVPIAVDHLQ